MKINKPKPDHVFRRNQITKAYREFRPRLTTEDREKLNADSKKKMEDWIAEGNEVEIIPSSQSNGRYNPASAQGAYL